MAEKKPSIIPIILYVLAINLLGWLGWMIAQEGTEDAVGLGNLVWLLSPLLMAIIMRLFCGGWKEFGLLPRLIGNIRWYFFSILVFPVIIGVVVLAGKLFGGISTETFNTGAFLQALAAAFIANFIKNIFEEFAWRGFLTPRLNAIVRKPIIGHLITGLIWGTWHIPYYLGLVDQTVLSSYTSLSLGIFIPMIVLGITISGILFGELRLITKSTWTVVLMHTLSNILILTLLVSGFIEVPSKTALFFTPSWEGILTMLLVAFAGVWLLRKRVKHN